MLTKEECEKALETLNYLGDFKDGTPALLENEEPKSIWSIKERKIKMKNLEKYYSEFMNKSHINVNCYWFKVIEGNEYCDNRFCAECGHKFLKWLNKEYKEVELTEDEKIILKNISEEYKYIVREKMATCIFIEINLSGTRM